MSHQEKYINNFNGASESSFVRIRLPLKSSSILTNEELRSLIESQAGKLRIGEAEIESLLAVCIGNNTLDLGLKCLYEYAGLQDSVASCRKKVIRHVTDLQEQAQFLVDDNDTSDLANALGKLSKSILRLVEAASRWRLRQRCFLPASWAFPGGDSFFVLLTEVAATVRELLVEHSAFLFKCRRTDVLTAVAALSNPDSVARSVDVELQSWLDRLGLSEEPSLGDSEISLSLAANAVRDFAVSERRIDDYWSSICALEHVNASVSDLVASCTQLLLPYSTSERDRLDFSSLKDLYLNYWRFEMILRSLSSHLPTQSMSAADTTVSPQGSTVVPSFDWVDVGGSYSKMQMQV